MKNKKKSWEEMSSHWDVVYKKTEEKEDSFGLKLVCYRNASLFTNYLVDKMQKKITNSFLKKIPLKKGTMLDIGTGTGRWAALLKNKGHTVFAIDFIKRIIDKNKKNTQLKGINFKNMSITDLKFNDAFFDLTLSITVLHHIPYKEQIKAIDEIYRVTKKNGYCIILESKNVRSHCKSVFPRTAKGWEALFTKKGFKKIKIKYWEYAPIRYAYRILDRNPIKSLNTVCLKLAWYTEQFCETILPAVFARQTAILFRKK